MSERIGWLGLGELGYPMAVDLLDSGYRLSVYNRTRSKAEPLAEKGAHVADTPLEVTTKGGIVVSVLWDSDTTEGVVTPDFLAHMEGGIHVGMCTGSPDAAQRLAKLHKENGSTYVEAPIFGRPEAVGARQLAIPYVGPQAAKDRVKPLLTAMGGNALYDMGEKPGVPTVVKQLGNFLIFSAARSLMEGLSIAESAGVDVPAAVKIADGDLVPGADISQLRQSHRGKEKCLPYLPNPSKRPWFIQSTCRKSRPGESNHPVLLKLTRNQ